MRFLVNLEEYSEEASRRADMERVVTPRVGVVWQPAAGTTVRMAYQDWLRPLSVSTLTSVETAGIPVEDRLVEAGGRHKRAVAQLAMELGPDQIRVNAILPGVVAGERQDRVLAAKAQANGIGIAEQRERAVARVSMRTMVEAEDIAQAAVYLASAAGRYVSGERLSVGGNLESLS